MVITLNRFEGLCYKHFSHGFISLHGNGDSSRQCHMRWFQLGPNWLMSTIEKILRKTERSYNVVKTLQWRVSKRRTTVFFYHKLNLEHLPNHTYASVKLVIFLAIFFLKCESTRVALTPPHPTPRLGSLRLAERN